MQIILAIIGSSALTTLIQQLFARADRKNRQDKVDRLLLLDAIKRQGKEYIQEGSISMKDLECFNEYYTAYKKLNGDGFADTLKDKVVRLPITE